MILSCNIAYFIALTGRQTKNIGSIMIPLIVDIKITLTLLLVLNKGEK